MEQLLETIVSETSNTGKLKGVHSTSTAALEFLNSYSRAPAAEYRNQVLGIVSACLESGVHRQCQHGKQILEKIGRDNRFYSTEQEENEHETIAAQVVRCLHPIPQLSQDVQVDMLQALLYLSCQSYWSSCGEVSLQIVSLCEEVCTGGTAARLAAQNTASSCLASFSREISSTSTRVDEILPILQYIVSRIEEKSRELESSRSKKGLQVQEFLIITLESCLMSIGSSATESKHFSTFAWRSLCPTIIRTLIRGKGYSMSMAAVQLLGHDASQRPILEAIFDRLLVQVPSQAKIHSLKAVNKLVSSDTGLVRLALQSSSTSVPKESNDMALIIMLFEVIDEITDLSDGLQIHESLDIINKILEKLVSWQEGAGLDTEIVEHINTSYSNLSDADYMGPCTYSAAETIPDEFKKITVDCINQTDQDTSSLDSTNVSGSSMEDQFDSSDSSNDTDEPDEKDLYLQPFANSQESSVKEEDKVPKYLHSPQSNLTDNDCAFQEKEVENANTFFKVFKNRVARLNVIRSTAEIDQKIQEFSSQFCQDFSSHSPRAKENCLGTILSGDGVYLTCYYSIHLAARLRSEGFFNTDDSTSFRLCSVSLGEFCKRILDSGTLVYISSTWLARVYENLTSHDLFDGKKLSSPLLNLCLDLENFASRGPNSALLAEFRRINILAQPADHQHKVAGRKLSRRILTAVWDYTIAVCSKPNIRSAKHRGLRSSLGLLVRNNEARNLRQRIRELESLNLRILNNLVELAKGAELYHLAGSAMRLIVDICCEPTFGKKIKLKQSRFRAIEKLFNNGLELASHSQDCWKHIFSCCRYIHLLEQNIFRSQDQTTDSTLAKSALDESQSTQPREEIWLGFMANSTTKTYRNLDEIFTTANLTDSHTFLSGDVASRCASYFSQKVEEIYASASNQLNLSSLLGFLQELVFQSRKQLIVCQTKPKNKPQASEHFYPEILLITKLTDSILQILKSARPLIHVMLAWTIAGQHFMEGGSHCNSLISKLSVQAIHDSISSLLLHHTEISYFHFNESLFKPYETLIMLELCDQDTQDQMIASIHQFVEGSSSEIRSGWKPLFGALRSVKVLYPDISKVVTDETHVIAIMDVFEAFLSTDNPVVFAHAALNCVMCLIKYIKGTMEQRELEELVDIRELYASSPGISESALGYMIRCHSILAKMYIMPACPVFWGAEKIQTGSQPVTVNTQLPQLEVVSFDPMTDTLLDFPFSFLCLDIKPQNTSILQRSGLTRVWFILLDGLVSALYSCPTCSQAETINTFFTIVHSMKTPEYISFGLFCVNHLLLPSVQSWIRSCERSFQGWLRSTPGVKQTLGLTTDLVMEWIKVSRTDNRFDIKEGCMLMMKQLVVVLVECCVATGEHVARFSCSCFRHLMSSQGKSFLETEWKLVTLGLCRAIQLSLFPVHQLMASFRRGSSRFYGDIGTVKIAARRDSTSKESNRLNQLAQQTLLMENQRQETEYILANLDDEDRSYLFLLEPHTTDVTQTNEDKKIRVTLRSLVTGLTAHNLLLNNIAYLAEEDLLDCLSFEQIQMLLIVLKQSSDAALEFDSRPGLKFLVQKVSQLPHAANLYTQNTISWKTRAKVLFQLATRCVTRHSLKSKNVEQILAKLESIRGSRSRDPDFKLYFPLLEVANLLVEISEKYLDLCNVSRIESTGQEKTKDKFIYDVLSNLGKDLNVNESYQENNTLHDKEVDDVDTSDEKDNSNKLLVKERHNSSSSNNFIEEIEKVIEAAEEKSVEIDNSIENKSETIEKVENEVKSPRSEPTSNGEQGGKHNGGQGPFQFSDFVEQPVRPDSPNLSLASEEDVDDHPDNDSNDRKESKPTVENDNLSEAETMTTNDKGSPEDVKTVLKEFQESKQIVRLTTIRHNPFNARTALSRTNSYESTDPEIEKQKKESLDADEANRDECWLSILLHILQSIESMDPVVLQGLEPVLLTGLRPLASSAKSLKSPNVKLVLFNLFRQFNSR